jgi:hypothetical protein
MLPDGAKPFDAPVGSTESVVFWKGAPEAFGIGTTLPEGRKPVDAIGAGVFREQNGTVNVGAATPGHEV